MCCPAPLNTRFVKPAAGSIDNMPKPPRRPPPQTLKMDTAADQVAGRAIIAEPATRAKQDCFDVPLPSWIDALSSRSSVCCGFGNAKRRLPRQIVHDSLRVFMRVDVDDLAPTHLHDMHTAVVIGLPVRDLVGG